MFNHKTKSSLDAHKQTLQTRMEKFVVRILLILCVLPLRSVRLARKYC